MTTELLLSSAINEMGQRENNEDAVFPNSEIHSSLSNLFIVCDGVGGHAKGEIASDLVCSQLAKFFEQEQVKVSTTDSIERGVQFVENLFDSYMLSNPDSTGMGTTLTLLHLHEEGATLAHIGDSRIYHLREGDILYRTKDHSYVQALVDLGEITEEEAAHHPNRNQITNAIQGASVRRAKPAVDLITNLRAGDLFILCTDGILESVTDEDFREFSREDYEVDTIALKMRTRCQGHSRDNFSAYIIKLTEAYIETLKQPLGEGKALVTTAAPSPEEVVPTKDNSQSVPNEEMAISTTALQEEQQIAPSFDRPQTMILTTPTKEKRPMPPIVNQDFCSEMAMPDEQCLSEESDYKEKVYKKGSFLMSNHMLFYFCAACFALLLGLGVFFLFSLKKKKLKEAKPKEQPALSVPVQKK